MPLAEKRPYQIFISHSTTDAAWIEQIAALVSALGVRPYLFQNDQQPGRAVADKLQQAICDSDAFMAVVTVGGGASTYLNQEIGFALGRGKPIIPIVELGVPSDQLAFLRDIEYVPVDFANQAEALTQLAGVIHRQVQAHVPISSGRLNADQALTGVVILLLGLAVLAAIASTTE